MAERTQQQRAVQSSARYLTCPQTVASKRTVPPHLSPWNLRRRRGCSPRQPWRDRLARWAGSPRRRAAPTEAPSSRTERAHSSTLHGPTCTHACQALESHADPILYTAPPVHHAALDATLCTCSSWCVRCDTRCQHRAAVPPRVSPPDPGAARHSTPARHHAAARAQKKCAEQLPVQSLT